MEEDGDDSSDYDPEEDQEEEDQEEEEEEEDDGNVPYNIEIYNIGVATREFLKFIHFVALGLFHFCRKNIVPLFNK